MKKTTKHEWQWFGNAGYLIVGMCQMLASGRLLLIHARGGKICDAPECNCGLPHPDNWSELDSCRWMTAREAREGHYSFCRQAETGVYLAKIS